MALFARANANTALLTNNCYLFKLKSHDVIFRSFGSHATKFLTGRRAAGCGCVVHSCPRLNITSNSQKNFLRKCHVTPHAADYKTFSEHLAQRRQQARKSIIVQAQSLKSFDELYTYCEQFGKVSEMHYYSVNNSLNFFLIEFDELESVAMAMEAATHINFHEIIPVQSPMLWFRNSTLQRDEKIQGSLINTLLGPSTVDGCTIPNNETIDKKLANIKSISDQMIFLHDAWKLSDVSARLRFLTAYQLEKSFSGLFPRIAVYPFGSSVNGFGRQGCDLDLVLNFEDNTLEKPSSRFIFHAKKLETDGKGKSKKVMEMIADSMQYFVPGVSNVRRILEARVPIIKYRHAYTGLECDLSLTNMSGVYMSEILCMYGEIDSRVRPLVFTVRHWAMSVGLTNATPGRWITNFSLCLMVLFYLQQRGILPSIDTLKAPTGYGDVRGARRVANPTFIRDVTKIPLSAISANTDSLETLLHGFFEFYSSFDFQNKAINLCQGVATFKPDFSPLHICNPLETTLNVSTNLKIEELEKIKLAFTNASLRLEITDGAQKSTHGILRLFAQKLNVVNYVEGKRVVSVSALFQLPDKAKKPQKQSPKNPRAEPNETISATMTKGQAKRR